ncbi:MAG: Hsp70 family protein [Fuerstiella sp.]|nr:Hsp70 family protein [Fuerstiella sp.]
MTAAANSNSKEKNGGSRYVVGIDLGTTNSAVGFVDTSQDEWQIQTFAIPQLVANGEVESRQTLPSFHYQPPATDGTASALKLPWSRKEPEFGVGVFAREFGRANPGRMIESAKSWLCHAGVDRRAALLPWHGAADAESLSPVDASSRYLQHIRSAWDHLHPDEPLAQQDVVITIPASFDEVARELTVAAARSAGLPRIVLIEEPQAAFYSWVNTHRDDWEQHVVPGQKILVCDIGGGTSDFTLIHVRPGDDGKVRFHRIAVGNHLMLGGDNLDLALACHVERLLMGDGKLQPRQWSVLVPTCRHVKETLLQEDAPQEFTIALPGSGSKLIGGGLQVTVRRDEVVQLLVDGFLPAAEFDEKPQNRQSGFQEFGLPYAADAAITKYLAAFLKSHADDIVPTDGVADSARPDVVLFNGGFFASSILRARLVATLTSWFRHSDEDWTPQILQNERLDLAVAHGAASFGMVRRGVGVKIVAGLARTYYVGIEDAHGQTSALCLVPAGIEPGSKPVEIERDFRIRTSEPVQFPIFVSGTRLTDRAGELYEINEEQLHALPPIRTVLQTRKKDQTDMVTARLSARLTEIGTLEMWCTQVNGDRRWQLQFDVRSSTETDREVHTGTAEQAGIVDQSTLDNVDGILSSVYSTSGTQKPDGLPRRIARDIAMSRADWPPSLLRSIWGNLIESAAGRKRSAAHEARWLNLLGFGLRPGFGMAADDWRVEQTLKVTQGKLVHASANTRTEWRILCRRIAGGITRGTQNELTSSVIALIRQKHRQVKSGRGKGADYASGSHEESEIWRMLASMELLDRSTRMELGRIALNFLPRPAFETIRSALIWSVGRIGARVPVYGPLNTVLPTTEAETWIESLIDVADVHDSVTQLALMQLSRRTDDRFRDISDDVRAAVVKEMESAGAPDHFVTLVRDGGELKSDEAGLVFGESLPTGLRIQ